LPKKVTLVAVAMLPLGAVLASAQERQDAIERSVPDC